MSGSWVLGDDEFGVAPEFGVVPEGSRNGPSGDELDCCGESCADGSGGILIGDRTGSAAIVSLAAKALDANTEAKKTLNRSALRIQKPLEQ